MKNRVNKGIIRNISASIVRNSHGKIPVRVKLRKDEEIETCKWEEGEHEEKHFLNHGHVCSGGHFFAQRPGTYTVFVKDKSGVTDLSAVKVGRALPFPAAACLFIFAAILIGLAAVTRFSFAGGAPKVLPPSRPDPVPAVQPANQKKSVQGQKTVRDNLALDVSFNAGSAGSIGSWQLANVKTNGVIIQAKIYIDGKSVATSPALRPGQSVKSIRLQKDVGPGRYGATAYISYYDLATQNYISSAGYHIGVTVAG